MTARRSLGPAHDDPVWRVHPDTAWHLDPASGAVHAMRMPDGRPVTLEDIAALVFTDVAAGDDPVAACLERWPDEPGVAETTAAFVRELVEAGVLEEIGVLEEADRPAAGPAPSEPVSTTRVVFVCTANICRSAYAQHRAHRAGLAGVSFSSAGTQALVGQPMDPPMTLALGENVPHRARQLTREVAESSDLILTMSRTHRSWVLDEWPHLAQRTFVLGHAARELATLPPGSSVDQVREHLWTHRTRHADDDVADPYARGQAAADACGRRIDALLEPVLTALSGVAGRGR
ncbi:hypothetical protein ACSDQ9_07675 [Aestuariimicrobium soli]|uniref:arsenate reductase/protein-tyrosine-phosphatase family protein n=1 Tax=Aestuariimicrobium soli TaxID=2035834 RepID=UPI003EB76B10